MDMEKLELILDENGKIYDHTMPMDQHRLENMVRSAASENFDAFIKKETEILCIVRLKSKAESDAHRQRGNRHYVNGEYKEALFYFNKALATAPKCSLELILAYSNISAVLLAIKAYQACKLNINACLVLGCPPYLKPKLDKRMEEANKHIAFEVMQDMIQKQLPFIGDYMKFNVKRNPEVPSASEDVSIVEVEGRKKIIAARDIQSGTMVALERAYVSTKPEESLSCYYCHKINFFHIPCEECHALFCSKECLEKCMNEYHRIECKITGYCDPKYDVTIQRLMTRAAIKMSLKLGWKELSRSISSKGMGAERLKKSSVKEAFDTDTPTSILCHEDTEKVALRRCFHGSIVSACVLHLLLTVYDYVPIETKIRMIAIDALRGILIHLYAKFTRKIEMICSAQDVKTGGFMSCVQRNIGWFSFASKLSHSCEPNLYVLGLNDQVALIALQRIKKGDELTISFVDHYYDTMIFETRARTRALLNSILFSCNCRVCEEQWDSSSHNVAELNRDQEKAYEKFKSAIYSSKGRIGNQFQAAVTALDMLTGSPNTTQQNKAYLELRGPLHIGQCLHRLNKGYDIHPSNSFQQTNWSNHTRV